MTPELPTETSRNAHLVHINALFDLLAEYEDSLQLDRLETLADQFPAEAVDTVRGLLLGLRHKGGFFEQPAAMHVSLDRHSVVGEKIGRWRVAGELGRGGQALVLAVSRIDDGFEQHAVLKVPLGSPPSADAVRRMLRERQLLATLKHPGLPALIDGGVLDDGAPFLVIARVNGQALDVYANGRRLNLRERVSLLRDVCKIVAYAHAQLVLHRDIKPANILVDSDGHVFLLDFGVAQTLRGDASVTSAGYTLAFAAPEQVRGERSTAATDVYGLAALACRLLGGQNPFADTPVSAQLRAVLEDEPTLPEAIDSDLRAILQRALRKEPAARYLSVADFDSELERWQLNRPVLAHAGGRRYRAGKWLRRWRLPLTTAVLLLAIAFAALWQAHRAEELATEVIAERDATTRDLRQQELLQDHYAGLFNRLLASDQPITPAELIRTLADTRQTVVAQDLDAQESMQVAIADLLIARNDFSAVIDTLEALAPRRQRLSPWDQVSFAESLASAYLRVGRIDEINGVLVAGEAAAEHVSSSRSGVAKASLAIIRAQLLRTQGDLSGALEQAHRAVTLSDTDAYISPMRRGQLLSNAALNAMYAGDIAQARDWARRGLDDWKRAGLESMVSYFTAATNLANLEQLSGHPARALGLYEDIEARASVAENATSRSARQVSMARALALMGQEQRALSLAQSAGEAFCMGVGPHALDCQRIRLAIADIANWLGNSEVSARYVASIEQTDAPAIASSLRAVQALLQLHQRPDASHVSAVDEALIRVAAQGGLGVRGSMRQRMGAAEQLLAAGHPLLARRLIEPLLVATENDEQLGGSDQIWLQLWRARENGTLSASVRRTDALAGELGDAHPSVQRWTAWRIADSP